MKMSYNLKFDTATSKHLQLRNWLEEQLKAKVFQPGDQLPGEAVLAKEMSISTITVRQAYEGLASCGLVDRIPYKGTFVADWGRKSSANSNSEILVLVGHSPDWSEDMIQTGRYRQDKILEAFEQEVSSKGYHCTIRHIIHGSDFQILHGGEQYAAACLLGDTLSPDEQTDIVLKLKTAGVPTVSTDYEGLVPVCRTQENLLMGVELALDHLEKLGHSSIGLITFETRETWGMAWEWLDERLSAFRLGCRQRNWDSAGKIWSVPLPFYGRTGEIINSVKAAAEELAGQFFKDGGHLNCTAVICANDRLAINFRAALRQLIGKQADELSVIGFDNISESQIDSLTTVVTPTREIGAGAAGMTVDLIKKGEGRNLQALEYPPYLLRRGSTGRPVLKTEEIGIPA